MITRMREFVICWLCSGVWVIFRCNNVAFEKKNTNSICWALGIHCWFLCICCFFMLILYFISCWDTSYLNCFRPKRRSRSMRNEIEWLKQFNFSSSFFYDYRVLHSKIQLNIKLSESWIYWILYWDCLKLKWISLDSVSPLISFYESIESCKPKRIDSWQSGERAKGKTKANKTKRMGFYCVCHPKLHTHTHTRRRYQIHLIWMSPRPISMYLFICG